MVCFNLTFKDYVEQYITNLEQECGDVCPVCYERHLESSLTKDVPEIVECYRNKIILDVIGGYKRKHGQDPDITKEFLLQILEYVDRQVKMFEQS